MDSIPLDFLSPTPYYVLDFGRIYQHSPSLVLKPNSPDDISVLLKHISSSPCYNNITVAARGAGHSTHGQAQALDGVVIDMTSLPTFIEVGKVNACGDEKERFFVDVGGGVLWVDLLKETLKHGLTPRTWTDYLFLTVGGTLSVGGIGGNTFKYGPQISDVLEMDVITGKGDFITCSNEKNSDLFGAVLGGLGQFGIIIRARIILDIAPKMVKCTKVSYVDFSTFTRDQELLLAVDEVDHLQGFIKPINNEYPDCSDFSEGTKTVFYYIDMGIYYNEGDDINQKLDNILRRLSSSRSMVHSLDFLYFDFLNRVRHEELRSMGRWEVPHPWLNIFVPRSHINTFVDLVLHTILTTPIQGPLLFYPILRHKWKPKMFTVLPKDDVGEDIFYVLGLLRSAVPSSCLEKLLNQNQKIIDATTSGYDYHVNKEGNTTDFCECQGGLGGKQYIPYCRDENEWRLHFGEEWEKFEAMKSKFDPWHILAPGQKIFKRRNKEA